MRQNYGRVRQAPDATRAAQLLSRILHVQAGGSTHAEKKAHLSMDLLTFFLAPIRGGGGPYLAFYFSAYNHWTASKIGLLLGTMALFFGFAQIPAGVVSDRLRSHRHAAIACLCTLGLAFLTMRLSVSLPAVLAAQASVGTSCAFFAPVVASLSLALSGYDNLNVRLARNEVFSHIGNVFTGALLGWGMRCFGGQFVVDVLIAFCALAAVWAASMGPNRGEMPARPAIRTAPAHVFAGFSTLTKSRASKIFTLAAVLYSFANASMLPLMIQFISRQSGALSHASLPEALLVTELVMIPVCAIAGRQISKGRKPLLLLSCLLLVCRGACFSMFGDTTTLVALQALDGVSAGIFTLLLTMIVADFDAGSGNFSSVLCSLMMLLTATNALSDVASGYLANTLGFQCTFALMAAIAACAALLVLFWLPETAQLGSTAADCSRGNN